MTAADNAHALKALLAAQHGAVKARTAAVNQINALLATAPAELRDRYRRHPTSVGLVGELLRCRPSTYDDPTTVAVLTACKALAQRVEFLDRQALDLTAGFRTLMAEFTRTA